MSAEQAVQPRREVGIGAASGRDGGDSTHAERNRRAMLQLVAALDLERVADGVPQVQRAPLTGLVRVARADRQLQARAALDDRVAARLVAPQRRRSALLDEAPQHRVADHRALDALGHPVAA